MKKTLAAQAALLICATALFAWNPEKKTVNEFLKMSPKDTTTCELRGVVTRVRNYSKGNLYIEDGTGSVLIYGVYPSGKTFGEIDVREGDTLTVSGRRYVYDGRVIEMKGARYVSHSEGPDHENVEKIDKLDKEPTFKGKDINEFSKWVTTHLVYPPEARVGHFEGKIIVSFIVGMDGTIVEPKIVQGSYPALDNEVLRVIRRAPKWKPGEVDGHTVRVSYSMPVYFFLNH